METLVVTDANATSSRWANPLIEKFQNRTAVVGIVGLGYVGLPLTLRFNESGFKVVGFDTDPVKVNHLLLGQSYIEHIDSEKIKKAVETGFKPTTDFSNASLCDALIICVPTPLNKYREPDLSFVTGSIEALLPHLRQGQIVSLESTTYPGTTDEELLPRLQNAGFKIGEDMFLVHSPEREDPGNPNFTTRTIPKICGGVTMTCLKVGVALYGQVIDKVVQVSTARAAELTKLLENIHRAVNIGLVNEMKIVADKMDIDIFEVIRAASSKPFGFTPYYPGPGIGGHCIPVDPFYLTWKAREFGVDTRFIELAGEINQSMPQWVVDKVADALNRKRKSLKGSKVLILGIAYKRNVDDVRESPVIQIMEILRRKEADISYSDPHIPIFPKMREHKFDLRSVPVTAESLKQYDCVVIGTNHSGFDYDMIKANAELIVDTRGAYQTPAKNVIKA